MAAGTATRDLERELAEWDGTWPDAWKPRPGEVLVGTIERYSTGQGIYGPVRTAILRKDDGSRASLWISSKVLVALFEAERPKVGERVGIRYCGKHEQKGYRKYTLIVDRAQGEPDFQPLGGEVGDAGAPGADAYDATPYAATTMQQQPRAPLKRGAAPRDSSFDDPFADE